MTAAELFAEAEQLAETARRHITEDPRDMRIAEVSAAVGQLYATLALAATQMRSLPAAQAEAAVPG